MHPDMIWLILHQPIYLQICLLLRYVVAGRHFVQGSGVFPTYTVLSGMCVIGDSHGL